MKIINGIKSFFLSIIIFSLLLCCSERPASPFKLAIVTWVGYGPFYVALEKGYFEAEGLRVEILKIEDEGARKSAFSTGRIQGAVNTIDTLASSVPNGLPGKAIFKIDESFGGDGIIARKEISDVKQLKGRTVAYPRGLPSHFFLLFLLDKNGLKPTDILSRNMEAGDAGAAFAAGRVDAAVTWEPWLSQAAKSADGHILVSSRDTPGILVDIFMITPTIEKSRRKDIGKLMRAWFRAIEFVKTNREEAYQIIANNFDLELEEVANMAEGLRFSDFEDNLTYFGIKGGENTFKSVFDSAERIWEREGIIKNPVSAEQVTALEFLKELIKQN